MTQNIQVGFKFLAHGAGLAVPSYESKQAAGMDLRAAIDAASPLTITAGARALVACGFALALPAGYEAQIRPRSGLALKHGITVLNAPGTVDADYRGEISVLLINHGAVDFVVERGMRIAQMIIAPVSQCVFDVVDDLDETARGAGGYGSTGT